MDRPSPNMSPDRLAYDRRVSEFWSLAQRIAQAGTRGAGRLAFLSQVTGPLLAFSRCRAAQWWMPEVDHDYTWRATLQSSGDGIESVGSAFELLPASGSSKHNHDGRQGSVSAVPLSQHIASLMTHLTDSPIGPGTGRSVLVEDEASRDKLKSAVARDPTFAPLAQAPTDSAVLLLLLQDDSGFAGLLALTSRDGERLPRAELVLYEQLADTIARAVINRRAQFRLRERIKELTCLHGVAQEIQKHGESLDAALRAIVGLLTPAMQFPELADAHILLEDRVYGARGTAATDRRLDAAIRAAGRQRGTLSVWYTADHPEFAGGAFLREEHDLLQSVAHEVGLLVERSDSAAAKASLAEQLRHADRLATIGQLAAGVAHELNEPLGNIMGFAQLVEKEGTLTDAARRDVRQIVRAALHGREVVKKLLLFSRQSDAARVRLDLNELIQQSVYFLEARCRQSSIELRLELANEAMPVEGVSSELTQVVVNLAVNAIQAMPHGGVLTIGTNRAVDMVHLTVTDTGHGMDEATQRRLFTPFFTTKDVGEGTGLGLSVVLGIVSAHGGTIHVESTVERGSRFVIQLPLTPNANTGATGTA